MASHSHRPDLIYAMSETRQLSFLLPNLTHDMPETQWALISTALPNLCYVRDTVATHSHRPFLIYALPETQWSLISIASNICYFRDTFITHNLRFYLIYAMSATRWCLIPTTLTLYMLCQRHSGLSFQPHRPYIRYVRDKAALIPTLKTYT